MVQAREKGRSTGPRERGSLRPSEVAAAVTRALGSIAREAQSRVPKADLDERDPDYIRESLPGMWLLASLWFRGEVRGLGRIPADGPVLLVGNHSGGNLTPDTVVFTLAFNTFFGVERRFYQLAHNLVLSTPGLGFLRKYGTVAASPQNADKALCRRGRRCSSTRAGTTRSTARAGSARRWTSVAARASSGSRWRRTFRSCPVVSVGGQETALFLSRGEWLSKLLGLDRMFRLKVLPISLALPWGLNVGDMLGHLPIPAKITIQVKQPIDLRERYGPQPDVDRIYDDLMASMQDTLTALQDERSLPVIG